MDLNDARQALASSFEILSLERPQASFELADTSKSGSHKRT